MEVPAAFVTSDRNIVEGAGHKNLVRVLSPAEVNQRTALTLLLADRLTQFTPEFYNRVNTVQDLDSEHRLGRR